MKYNMLINSGFMEFKRLYDTNPEGMKREYIENSTKYMINKYNVSKSTIHKYFSGKRKIRPKIDAVLARKMRNEGISDTAICKKLNTNSKSLWMAIGPKNKEFQKKSKRIGREYVEVRNLPKVRWENKEPDPYYDTSNIVEMGPIKALFSKINNYDSFGTTASS